VSYGIKCVISIVEQFLGAIIYAGSMAGV